MTSITPHDLARWRAGDILNFARRCCPCQRYDGTIGPLEFSERQAGWLRAVAERRADGYPRWRMVGIVSPKRSGKTQLGAIALLWKALTTEDSLSVCLGNSRESAESLAFAEASKMIRRGPLEPWADLQRGTILFPDLASEIRAVPCSAKSVAGLSVSGLLLSDELWQADDTEPWDLLSSQVLARGATLMISQASGLDSPVYRLYQAAERGELRDTFFDYVTPEWLREHLSPNPAITAEVLAERRAALGIEAVYQHFFENSWGEEATLLTREDIAAATVPGDLPRTRADLQALLAPVPAEDCWFYAALDRAMPGTTTGDDSVWTTCAVTPMDADHTERVVVVQSEVLPSGSEAEVQAAARFAREITRRTPLTALEVYQAGDLVRRLPNAHLVTPSAQLQYAAFSNLGRLFHERRIAIPEGAAVLLEQLGKFGVSTATALPRFGKKISGNKDDTVYSLALAAHAHMTDDQVTEGTHEILSLQEMFKRGYLDLSAWRAWRAQNEFSVAKL